MRLKRSFFITLILFFIISSVSFVGASDISANDVNDTANENVMLAAVSDSSSLAVDIELDSNGELSSTLCQMDNIQSTDETENGGDEAPVLGAKNNEEILGAPVYPAGNSVQDIMNAITSAQPGDTIYLNGGTYTGTASVQNEGQVYLRNIKIVGGTPENPDMYATIIPNTDAPNDNWKTALSFGGKSKDIRCIIDGKPVTKTGFYSNTGYMLEGVSFEHIKCTGKFLSFSSGSLTDCTINDCYSEFQFICLSGSYWDNVPIPVKNCNFINCHQTYVGDDGVNDGTGQLGAVFGVNMTNCKFINTSSAQHGGALCIADESEWGSARVASILTDCEFINVTSRWFAVYIHGNFRTSYAEISTPQIIDNCKFINCTGTGEYSAGVGISHDNLIVRNSEFDNCTGGQGAAIMVGGLDSSHEGFSGRNTKGNNVSIINCTFRGNVAKKENQTSSFCKESFKSIIDTSYDGSQRYDFTNPDAWLQGAEAQYTQNDNGAFFRRSTWWGGYEYLLVVDPGYKEEYPRFDYNSATGEYTQNDNGAYYQKHPAVTFYPSGNAGAVYVYGNDTKIFNCTFDGNEAESGDGAAIYIVGSRTNISNTKFYNHDSINGTVYILGENTTISENTHFKNNTAKDSGACVYIRGNNTQINNTKFDENCAVNGAGIFIKGRNTTVISSEFNKNNATNGGAVYIEGNLTKLNNNKFNGNNVTNQGGAVFVRGDNSEFTSNNFTYNEAVPASSEGNTGLGGAIYVKGDNSLTLGNDFEHNKARNGSGIYSSGNNLTVVNDIFRENQAWSYVLLTVAEPEESLYNTEDVEIEVVHFGGDNMVNAIYNNASNTEIRLKNVTYANSYGKELHTKENEYEYPADGVENSEQGTKLYQDDREYHQILHINVTDEDGNLIYEDNTTTTNLYGDIYVTLPKSKLKVGKYTVNAMHPEDWNYKKIKNSATFVILRHVDLSVEKTSDKIEYFDDDIAKWTITVKNAANGTNATNVVVDDILPSDFEFINCTTENGTYDNHTGLWTIGFMGNGTEATLVIYALVESDIERLNHIVHIDCEEKNTDVSFERTVTPEKDEYKEGDEATWTITVTNNGAYKVHDVSLNHVVPFEFELKPHTNPDTSQGTYDEQNNRTWVIGDIESGHTATLVIYSVATSNFTTITNLINLDYKEKQLNLTANKSSDKDEYHDGEQATLTIKVHNGDGCTATNVVLNDVLQSEFEFVSCDDNRYDKTNNVWNIGNMPVNTDETLVIVATAKRIYGDVTNVAVVTSDETDWDETNNEADRTVKVSPIPEPKKIVNNRTPNYGNEILYDLIINNTGITKYTNNLTVIDSLPEGLEFVGLVDLTGARSLNGTKQEGNKLIWVLTDIAPETPAKITIKVKVVGLGELITDKDFIDGITGREDIKYIGNLTNNLTIIGPNGTEKTVNRTVYPVPIVDLSVEITSDKDEYFVDDVATWTIAVKNAVNGTNATYVNLTNLFDDDFHGNFVIVNWTTENGTYDNVTGKWTIGNMTNGTEAVLVIKALAKTPGTNINHNVNVKGVETEWNYDNNDAKNLVDIVELPDIEKTVSNETPYYNAEIEYNLTITNKGTTQYSNNLTVVDSLPEGLKYISYVVTYATSLGFKQEGNDLIWNLTNIDSNRPALITIKVKVVGLGDLITDKDFIDDITGREDIKYIGNLTNNATLIGPNGTEKTVNRTVYPVPIVDLSVDISSDKDEYFVDDVATWIVTVHNAGNGTNATYVNLTDLFDDDFHGNFVIVNWTTENGTYDNVTGKWTIGNMTNGNEAVLVIKALAKTPGTNINHNAAVVGVETEWDYDNNEAKKPVNVYDLPDIKKTVSNKTPTYHDEILYNLTITNTGSISYTDDLILVDSLPDGLEFVGLEGVIHVKVNSFDRDTLTWNLTNLESNVPAVITIRVKVNAVGNLTNNLTLTGPNGTEKKVNCTVEAQSIVDLSVNKTADRDWYYYHDVVVWTITVKNAGNASNATNVNLTDFFPADKLEFINCTVPVGTSYNNQTHVWTIGNMTNGTELTLVINSRAIVTGEITNVARVDVKETDWNPDNNVDDDVVDILPIVDLSVNKTADRDWYYYHDVVVWTITVKNAGNASNATNVNLTDFFPADKLEFINCTVPVGTSYNNQTHVWTIGNMTNGTELTLVINSCAIVTCDINNAGHVESKETDWNDSNNDDEYSVNVLPIVDVSVNITSDKDEYFVDDVATWTIVVHNAANGTDATSVNLTEVFPTEYFDIINFTTQNGTYYSNNGTWNIGFMGNGTDAVLVITGRAKNPGKDIPNSVGVVAAEKEWNYDNNDANNLVDIVDLPDIEKTVVDKEHYYYHDEVDYNITITNKGTTNYTNELTVSDSLPKGLEFVEIVNVTGADVVSFDESTLTWVLTNITPETPALITVRVRITEIDNLTNNATLTGPNGTEKKVDCTIESKPYVDLSVEITSDRDNYFVDDVAIWTITVHNAGNGTNATYVNLTDYFPDGNFDIINVTTANGTFETGIWTIGPMGNGTDAVLVIYSRAIAPGNDIDHIVEVDGAEDEWDYDNNNANRRVNVFDLPDIEKTVSNETPNYHDEILYNLTITNTGSISYTDDLILVDSLPDGLEFVGLEDVMHVTVNSFDKDSLTWNLTNLEPNIPAVITIRVRVTEIGNLTNNLTLTGPNGTEKKVNCTVEAQPIVDLSVVKYSDKDEYFVDDIAVWTIIVHNAGNGTNATDVILADFFPSMYFEFINFTTDNGTYYSNNGTWNIGFMGNGTDAKLTIVSRAKVARDDIINIVMVVCNETDWDKSNNVANKTVDVIDLPDIEKTVSNYTPYYHDEIEYNLTITNTGTTVYTNNLTVVDSLPKGLEFVSIVNLVGAKVVNYDEDSLTWVLTDISPDVPAVITLKFRVTEICNLTNNLTLTGPNGTDKTVNCTVDVQPIVDLSVVKYSDKDEYFVDDIAVWTIIVHNAGNGTNATDVILADFFPSMYFEFINFTTDNGTFDSGLWNIGFMGNGTDAKLTIVSRAKVARDDIINIVMVVCNETDWDKSNNVANKTVDVIDLPAINKTASDYEPYYHDEIFYNLTIINTGTTVYENNLTVVDSLPKGLEFISVENVIGAKVVSFDKTTLTWVLTDIGPDVPAVITLKFRVTEIGNLTNNLTLTGPEGTEKIVNCTVDVQPIVDLSVNITSDKDEYFVDDVAVWTIIVHNAGNGTNASNVVLSELLPDEFEFINASSGAYNNVTNEWTIGTLSNGSDITLVIYSRAKTPASNITNKVNASCDEDEWNYVNNDANKTVEIVDLPSVEKSVNNSTPYYHEVVEYNLTVKNTGNTTYTNNLTVVDSLPSGLEFIETINVGGASIVVPESVNGQTVTWVITNVTAKSSAVITVRVKVNALGNLTNNLTIVGPSGTSSTVNCTINPIPIADLQVIKTNDFENAVCYNGNNVIWLINVTNIGPNDAINVKMSDLLPAGLIYVSDDSDGAYNNETGIWNIGDLSSGKSVTLRIVTLINTSNVTILNKVNVTSDTFDSNLENNYDNSSVFVESEADLEIIKQVSNATVHKNDEIIWTIIVTNNGPDAAVDTVVTDKLPGALVYVSDDSQGTYNHETGIWNVGNLASGESAILNIISLANTTNETIINLADVTSHTHDPNQTNNYCNNSTHVPPEADLALTIVPNVDEVTVGDEVDFTITVVNQGPDTAENTRVYVDFPDELKLLSFEPSVGNYDPDTGIWTIGDLAPGEEVTLVLHTKALESGEIIIEANAVCDTYEINLSNNNDTAEITVVEPNVPPVNVQGNTQKMHATGNPIELVLLALLALVGVSLRRRN